MAKSVFSSHEMVAHVWNAQTQDSGRVGGQNRVYFEGRAIYSYGSHFVLGFIMPDGTALLNSNRHSISTSKHQRIVENASNNRTQLNVPALTELCAYRYSPLQRIGLDYRGAPEEQRDIESVRKHVEKYCLQIDRDAAEYLLSIAGEKKPAAAFNKMQAARIRSNAKEKTARQKADLQQLKLESIRAADMSNDDFRDYLARLLDRTYESRGSYPKYQDELRGDLPAAIKLFWKYARTSKLGVSKARIAKIKARRLVMLAKAENFAFEKGQANRHAKKRALIRYIREMLPRFVANEALSSSTLWSMHTNLMSVGKVLGGAMRARDLLAFDDLSNHALAQNRAMAEIEAAAAKAEYDARVAARVERERLAEIEKAAAREKWFAGDSAVRWHGSDESGRAYVRAIDVSRDAAGNVTGGTLQTSHGADVPLVHAVRAFRFLKLCHDTGRTWHANGKTIAVGHFRIEIVTPEYFKAGCHTIGWNEVERVALDLGVYSLPADESALIPSRELA